MIRLRSHWRYELYYEVVGCITSTLRALRFFTLLVCSSCRYGESQNSCSRGICKRAECHVRSAFLMIRKSFLGY